MLLQFDPLRSRFRVYSKLDLSCLCWRAVVRYQDVTILPSQRPFAWTCEIFFNAIQVCPVESDWVSMILPKLRNADVKRLSGGNTAAAAAIATAHQDLPAADAVAVAVQSGIARKDQVTVDAARARYLNRKATKIRR